MALSGQPLADGTLEKSLITNFELLNLVPTYPKSTRQQTASSDDRPPPPLPLFGSGRQGNSDNHESIKSGTGEDPTATKWRRVGYVSGTSVHLDTIVWPGGDIVVSGTKVLTQSNNLN